MSRFFVITGTDKRNLHLATSLHKKGYAVAFWNTDLQAENIPYVTQNELLQEPCVLVLPLGTPAHQVLSALQSVSEGSFVFGGDITPEGNTYALQHGITYANILDDDSFCIQNAIPTAEGVLKTAIANTDRTISGMQVLVLGYGRVGQAVCRLLLALGADVTAFTPSDKEIAWGQLYCVRAVPLSELSSFLAFAQTIINTIPALVLGEEELDQVQDSTLIIDMASGAGGVDYKHAEKRELRSLLLKGIPGVDAPVSAAQYIEESILHTLSQTNREGCI